MSCPYHAHLSHSETDAEIDADFAGKLDADAFSLFIGLAAAVRAAQPPRPVRLDISRAETVQITGMPGLLKLAQAAVDVGVALQIVADAQQVETLTGAGLAHLLYSGP